MTDKANWKAGGGSMSRIGSPSVVGKRSDAMGKTSRNGVPFVPRKPEIALLISTYQRPQHLRRALLSIALQREVSGKIEVVVTDDGSVDETPEVVREFAQSVDFPVRFTTHPHVAFQLARCRNEGVAASEAPYLLFLDGDCILPPDHVAIHLKHRTPNQVMAGILCRLDQADYRPASMKQSFAAGNSSIGRPRGTSSPAQMARKARNYQWLRHPTKPKLFGNNVGIWRTRLRASEWIRRKLRRLGLRR